MPWLSRLSRITLACLLISAGAWVAMPAVQFLAGDHGLHRVDPPRSPPLDRRSSEAPRHVIREEGPPGRAASADAFHAPDPSWPDPTWDGGAVANQLTGPAEQPPSAPLHAEPMPPLPAAFSRRPPALDATYRSTVEMPPPPLLDAHSPPPLTVAGSRADSRPRGAELRLPLGVPHQYVVRDGDDLTSIAVRFYGSPAAAEAIYTANRDRLVDPKILPIGLSLQLPPPGSAVVPSGHRDRVIEPL